MGLQPEETIKARRPVTSAIPVDAVVTELLQLTDSTPAIELETVEAESSSDPVESEQDPAGESE
jgi:hypothetical protein